MTEFMNSPVRGDQADIVQGAGKPNAISTTDSAPANATAPVEYPLHFVTSDYGDFTEAEFEALCRSVRKDGLLIPIVIWRGQTVDGKHRTKACKKEDVPLRYSDITEECQTEEDMRAHVAALNQHRRANTKPLTTAEKRARIEAALKANPDRPNLQIAQELGVSDNTVASARREMEGRSQIANTETRIDSTGRKQRARKKSSPPKKLSEQVQEHEQVRDDEPTLFDDRSPSLAPEASPQEKGDAAPPEPQQPQDLTREYLGHILGAVRALARVPTDADFDRMASIIDLSERKQCEKDLDMAAKVAHRLRLALIRSDLERGDPPTLPPAAA